MKKKFKVEVECANCAAKMEEACKKIGGIKDISINFLTQKMAVDFVEGVKEEEILKNIEETCRKIERDFEFIG
ncbi:cation transporter [Peptoniphilaceae bacterium SGI.131]